MGPLHRCIGYHIYLSCHQLKINAFICAKEAITIIYMTTEDFDISDEPSMYPFSHLKMLHSVFNITSFLFDKKANS